MYQLIGDISCYIIIVKNWSVFLYFIRGRKKFCVYGKLSSSDKSSICKIACRFYNEMQRKINCNISFFEARPVFLHDDVRIKAHFLICFLSLVIYRYLERELKHAFTCETILDKLKTINFADIQEQGFIPLYTCDKLTDALHEICEFDTDFKFITKSHMKTIQKKSKGRK